MLKTNLQASKSRRRLQKDIGHEMSHGTILSSLILQCSKPICISLLNQDQDLDRKVLDMTCVIIVSWDYFEYSISKLIFILDNWTSTFEFHHKILKEFNPSRF